MRQETRMEIVADLAKLASQISEDGVAGFVLVAVHNNGSTTELLCPPLTPEHVDKLMGSIDRTHFRMQLTCYIGPKGLSTGQPPSSEEMQ